MPLKERAEALGVLSGRIKIEDDAVGIANRRGAEQELSSGNLNLLVKHFPLWPNNRYCLA
jgi:hypothetical protein